MTTDPTTGRASMQMAEAQVALLTTIQRIIAPLSEGQGRDLIEHWWGEEMFGIYLDWLDEAPDAPTGTEQAR